MRPVRILREAWEVSDHMLVLVASCVEDWFRGEPLGEDEFIDRLVADYLFAEGWDIESFNTSAVRIIMQHARRVKRDLS